VKTCLICGFVYGVEHGEHTLEVCATRLAEREARPVRWPDRADLDLMYIEMALAMRARMNEVFWHAVDARPIQLAGFRRYQGPPEERNNGE